MRRLVCSIFLLAPVLAFGASAKRASLSIDAVNDLGATPTLTRRATGAAVLRAQILLDRAHFSPGELDASFGGNMETALRGFQRHADLEPTGAVDAATWAKLAADASPVLVDYTITPEDVAGPFAPIPDDMMEKAALPALGYTSAAEALGEKFHIKPELLARLNRGRSLETEGETLAVPSIDDSALPAAAKIIVSRAEMTVALGDASGAVYAQFPSSSGSEHDPLPIGSWKVLGVARNPVFHYNPDLFWDADPTHAKAEIKPGPNNPVGVVWIALSIEHYGIHGTPEPSKIGKTQSHGCIRLTNWSARQVADAVRPGTPAILVE